MAGEGCFEEFMAHQGTNELLGFSHRPGIIGLADIKSNDGGYDPEEKE